MSLCRLSSFFSLYVKRFDRCSPLATGSNWHTTVRRLPMARWDKLWRDDAYVARNWVAPDPDIVRLSPVVHGGGGRRGLGLGGGAGRAGCYVWPRRGEMGGRSRSCTQRGWSGAGKPWSTST